LTIRHIGARTAQILADHLARSTKIMAKSADQLASVNEIGPVIAQSVYDYFHSAGSDVHHRRIT